MIPTLRSLVETGAALKQTGGEDSAQVPFRRNIMDKEVPCENSLEKKTIPSQTERQAKQMDSPRIERTSLPVSEETMAEPETVGRVQFGVHLCLLEGSIRQRREH